MSRGKVPLYLRRVAKKGRRERVQKRTGGDRANGPSFSGGKGVAICTCKILTLCCTAKRGGGGNWLKGKQGGAVKLGGAFTRGGEVEGVFRVTWACARECGR